ncbi:unnamed protein product [Callosobruchus maculatus]|nr:unnamed protein product [Callosobruchus maculatus]
MKFHLRGAYHTGTVHLDMFERNTAAMHTLECARSQAHSRCSLLEIGLIGLSRIGLYFPFSWLYIHYHKSLPFLIQAMNTEVAQIILKQNYDILRKLEELEQSVKNLEELNCILAELVKKKIGERDSTEDKTCNCSERVVVDDNNDMKYDNDDAGTRFTGTVKWYDRLKGFGFIYVPRMNTDVYVNTNSIQSVLRFLYAREPVEFEIQSQNGKLSAVNVKKLNEIETEDTNQPMRSRKTSNTDTETDSAVFEENDEEFQPQLDTMILRSNTLNERLISLRAMSQKLKQQIKDEKLKWIEELKETAVLDKKFKEAHTKAAAGYQDNNYQMFRDFMFFAETSRTIDEAMRKKHYEQWLNEIEHDCNDELEKITKSITRLKPLKDIISKWDLEKGSGDHATQKEETAPLAESDEELEATSSKITITNMPEDIASRNEADYNLEEENADEDKTVMNMPLA